MGRWSFNLTLEIWTLTSARKGILRSWFKWLWNDLIEECWTGIPRPETNCSRNDAPESANTWNPPTDKAETIVSSIEVTWLGGEWEETVSLIPNSPSVHEPQVNIDPSSNLVRKRLSGGENLSNMRIQRALYLLRQQLGVLENEEE